MSPTCVCQTSTKHNLVLASCLLRRRPVCVPMTRTRTAPGTAPATRRHVVPQIHAQPPCSLSCSYTWILNCTSATRLTTMLLHEDVLDTIDCANAPVTIRQLIRITLQDVHLKLPCLPVLRPVICRVKEEHRRRLEQVYSEVVARRRSVEFCLTWPNHIDKAY